MSRFLCIAPPYAGHVFPIASIGAELQQRGHDVAFVSYETARRLLPVDCEFFPVPDDAVLRRSEDAARSPRERFVASEFTFFYRDLVAPMALSMLPAVEAVLVRWQPDVVLADQHALAGPMAARKHGVRWATSSSTSMLHGQALDEHAPARRWLAELFAQVQRDAGVPPVDEPDISPHLVLLYSSSALSGESRGRPAHYHFVGPALLHRREDAAFPWERLQRRPRVLVSLGSVLAEQGRRFFETVTAALGGEAVEVVVGAPDGMLPSMPANFVVQRWLPQMRLLQSADAAVSAGGSFAFEALACGVPLVLAPISNDQFTTTRQIVAAGAGVRVRYARVGATELRDAVHQVLHEPAIRAAARAAQAGLRAAGGTQAAADLCLALASAPA